MFGSLSFRLAHGLKVWPWDESFFIALDCVKRLEIKGFASCQRYSINLFLRYWQIMLAISPRHAIVSPVASATHNTKKIPR